MTCHSPINRTVAQLGPPSLPRSWNFRREFVARFTQGLPDKWPCDPLQWDFHPARPLGVFLASVRPYVDVNEPTRRRALREWTLKSWQTVFSVVDDSQGKVKGDISTLTLLHEHALVIGASSTL